MKILRVITVFLTLFLIDLLASCEGPCSYPRYEYSNCGIELYYVVNNGNIINYTNTRKENFRLKVELDRNIGLCKMPSKRGGLFMNIAYADECINDTYIGLETVTDFKIITTSSYNNQYSTGDDITDLFRISYKVRRTNFYESVDEFLDFFGQKEEISSLVLDEPINLFFKQTPEAGTYSFKVQITLSDGRILESSLGEIELT